MEVENHGSITPKNTRKKTQEKNMEFFPINREMKMENYGKPPQKTQEKTQEFSPIHEERILKSWKSHPKNRKKTGKKKVKKNSC